MTTSVAAQEIAVEPAPLPELIPRWMVGWSPLRLYAELPKSLYRSPRPPALLVDPDPRVGAFWTGGNPAGLRLADGDRWAGFRAGYADGGEGLRRPLDPEAPAVVRFLGVAWRPVAEGASVAGLLDVAREQDRPRSRALGLRPYGSSPFIPVDTTNPGVETLRVRLEGASAYELGEWSLGAAVGYEALDSKSQNSAIARLGRATAAGLAVGLGWSPRRGGIWVGVDARWRGASENASVLDVGRRVVASLLHGFVEPEPVGPVVRFSRRFDSDARSVGLALEARRPALRWTAFAKVSDNEQTQTSILLQPGFEDRWRADGFTAGFGIEGLLRASGLRMSAEGIWNELSGAAERHDLTGAIYRADESELALRGEVRSHAGSRAWGWGGVLELRRESRQSRDLILSQVSHVVDWRFGGTLEVSRAIGDNLAVSLSYGLLTRHPDGVLPELVPDGPIYSALVEPALVLEGLNALAQSASLTLAWRPPRGAGLWARASFASVGVDPEAVLSPLFERRSALSLSVGVTLPNLN